MSATGGDPSPVIRSEKPRVWVRVKRGRGFAVAAVEVRKLSRRSGAAAKGTEKLIANGVNRVVEGGCLVKQLG